jgi:hypothetical protein
MKHLKQASEKLAKTSKNLWKTLHTYAISKSNTYWNTWNICLQHACICNIQIYFCNIHIKHLKHTSGTDETFGTYIWNIHV